LRDKNGQRNGYSTSQTWYFSLLPARTGSFWFVRLSPKSARTKALSIGSVAKVSVQWRRKMTKAAWVLFLLILPILVLAQEHRSPYTGEEQREIKALSPDEVRGYFAGEGLGLAKAAEINGYPGPLHVLQLAAQLHLTEAEKADTEQLRDVMLRDATRLGKLIVEKESELDKLFAGRKIDETQLRSRVAEIAGLQGELRVVHLRAHLEMMRILTPGQIKRYAELRGYQGADAVHNHQQHGN
jgi:Spy/CpxP family protein refolding chaperone